MIILKVTKKQSFNFSLEDTFLEKSQPTHIQNCKYWEISFLVKDSSVL